jgi:uncharacterized HAD superfamily protein
MKKLNIGIDIDGTVTEPYYWLPAANRYFNTQVKPEEITDYEIHKAMGIERQDYERFYAAYGRMLHGNAKLRAGVHETLHGFSASHGLHFITAREEDMRDISADWLQKHDLPASTLWHVGGRNKSVQAKKLGCDVFLEDCYQNAIMLAEAGIPVLLLDLNYNQGTLPKIVTRVKNWHQIRRTIESMSGQMDEMQTAM